MKKQLLTLAVFLFSLSAFSQQGMVAYWDFDEGSGEVVADQIGGSEGTLTGAAEFTTEGKYGSAVSFDGSDAVILTDLKDVFLNADDLSMMAWFKTNAADAQQHILWVGENGGNGWGSQAEIHLTINHYDAAYQVGNLNAFYGSCDNDQDSAILYMNEDNLLENETWYHVAFVIKDMGNIPSAELYLNGVLVSAVDWPDTETNWLFGSTEAGNPVDRHLMDMPFQIGAPDNTNRFFNGVIDEVRVYDKALTDAEIAKAMEGGIPTISARTIEKGQKNYIYPSASNGIFHIKNSENINAYQVLDFNGKILLSNQVNQDILDLNVLKQGVYFVNLQSTNDSHVQKIIVR